MIETVTCSSPEDQLSDTEQNPECDGCLAEHCWPGRWFFEGGSSRGQQEILVSLFTHGSNGQMIKT